MGIFDFLNKNKNKKISTTITPTETTAEEEQVETTPQSPKDIVNKYIMNCQQKMQYMTESERTALKSVLENQENFLWLIDWLTTIEPSIAGSPKFEFMDMHLIGNVCMKILENHHTNKVYMQFLFKHYTFVPNIINSPQFLRLINVENYKYIRALLVDFCNKYPDKISGRLKNSILALEQNTEFYCSEQSTDLGFIVASAKGIKVSHMTTSTAQNILDKEKATLELSQKQTTADDVYLTHTTIAFPLDGEIKTTLTSGNSDPKQSLFVSDLFNDLAKKYNVPIEVINAISLSMAELKIYINNNPQFLKTIEEKYTLQEFYSVVKQDIETQTKNYELHSQHTRDTVHFAINSQVGEHSTGSDWHSMPVVVIEPFKPHINEFCCINAVDSWSVGSFKLTNPIIVIEDVHLKYILEKAKTDPRIQKTLDISEIVVVPHNNESLKRPDYVAATLIQRGIPAYVCGSWALSLFTPIDNIKLTDANGILLDGNYVPPVVNTLEQIKNELSNTRYISNQPESATIEATKTELNNNFKEVVESLKLAKKVVNKFPQTLHSAASYEQLSVELQKKIKPDSTINFVNAFLKLNIGQNVKNEIQQLYEKVMKSKEELAQKPKDLSTLTDEEFDRYSYLVEELIPSLEKQLIAKLKEVAKTLSLEDLRVLLGDKTKLAESLDKEKELIDIHQRTIDTQCQNPALPQTSAQGREIARIRDGMLEFNSYIFTSLNEALATHNISYQNIAPLIAQCNKELKEEMLRKYGTSVLPPNSLNAEQMRRYRNHIQQTAQNEQTASTQQNTGLEMQI